MKYLSIFIATLLISINVFALDLSSFTEAISKINPITQTNDVLDSKNKCFNKTVKCKDGFKVSTDKLSCEIKMCSTVTAKSIGNTSKKQDLFYNKSKKCYEPKVNKCQSGFESKENKCVKVNCKKQPSIANSSKTVSDYLYTKEKCYIAKLPTTCKTGYILKNANTDVAKCEKNLTCKEGEVLSGKKCVKKMCSSFLKDKEKSKNLKGKMSSEFGVVSNLSKDELSNLVYNKTKKCWEVKKTKCKEGELLSGKKCVKKMCSSFLKDKEKSKNLKGKMSSEFGAVSNLSKDELSNLVYNKTKKCWEVKKTKCKEGELLSGKKCVKNYCKKEPSIINSSKTVSDYLYTKEKCYIAKLPTACKIGFSLKNANTNMTKCEKLANCLDQPSSAHRKTSEEKIIGGCYKTVAKTCDDAYSVLGEICVKKTCSTQPSVSNSTKTIKDFLYEEEKCFINELATECEAMYELKNENTNTTFCEKIEKCSRQPSLKNSTETIDNFLYEAGNCIIEKLPTECEDGYSIYKPETSSSKCKRKSKGSRRN